MIRIPYESDQIHRYEIELEVKHQVCETDPSILVAGEEVCGKKSPTERRGNSPAVYALHTMHTV